jgi:hypothetical protein
MKHVTHVPRPLLFNVLNPSEIQAVICESQFLTALGSTEHGKNIALHTGAVAFEQPYGSTL